MRKFNVQDRIVLDEMIDAFKKELVKTHQAYKIENKKPIITQKYWEQMIDEVQSKIDLFTTSAAIKVSNQYK